MKVLAPIVIPPHLSASGAVNAALAISRSLRRHCDIDVALMSDVNEESFDGPLRVLKRRAHSFLDFTVGWLPNKYRTLFYRSDIAASVKDYDLVHIHNAIPAFEMKRIAQACLNHRVPYVVTTHGFVEVLGLESAYQLSWFHSLVGRWCMLEPVKYVVKHASHICCLAPQDQQLLMDLGVPEHRTSVIPNGVSKEYYHEPSTSQLQAVCQKFELPQKQSVTSPVCFFLANHTRNKGLDILMDAFLATQQPYCLIVGGKKRDMPYEQWQARTGPGQRIVVTDALTDEEIRALHHYADLFVFPSRADTLPLVVLEAMAAGRPVLSTRVGGIPFQIDDSCGRLVEPENPESLRLAFEALSSDPIQLRTMGQAALKKVRARFNWDRSADPAWEVYQQVLGLATESSSLASQSEDVSDLATSEVAIRP